MKKNIKKIMNLSLVTMLFCAFLFGETAHAAEQLAVEGVLPSEENKEMLINEGESDEIEKVTALTDEGASQNFDENLQTISTSDKDVEEQKTNVIEVVTDVEIETKPFETFLSFDTMTKILSEQIKDDAEFNVALMNYKYLEKGYNLQTPILDYICNLIISGYSGKDVIDAAYFWLDTSEDFSIIKEMCDWKNKNVDYDGKFWEENAFNFVTKDKCGVLSDEDFEGYIENGVTINEILIANRLSRKGVYTIQNILEKYQNGASMTEIAIEIDSNLYESKKIEYNPSAEKNASFSKVDDADIFVSRELAIISGQGAYAYVRSVSQNLDLSVELENLSEKITKEIKAELKSGGYFRTTKKGSVTNE